MTRALLHRALVLVSGQPDTFATPRECPAPVLERITLTELDNEVAMDAERAFPEPEVPVDPQLRARVLLASITASIALIAFGVLLLLFPRHAESAALVLLVGPR